MCLQQIDDRCSCQLAADVLRIWKLEARTVLRDLEYLAHRRSQGLTPEIVSSELVTATDTLRELISILSASQAQISEIGPGMKPSSKYRLKTDAAAIVRARLAALSVELDEIERLQTGDAAERIQAAERLTLAGDDLTTLKRAQNRTPSAVTVDEIGREVLSSTLNRAALQAAERELDR